MTAKRETGKPGVRTSTVGLGKRDNSAELMRWGVSFAAIAAVHAAVAFGMIQRDEESRANAAPEAAIMIDLPPELDLPPAESVESVAASAAEEVDAPEATEPPPPETAEAIAEPPPAETVEETVPVEEVPPEEAQVQPETETPTAEAPEAVEALPPEETVVSEVVLPPPPRPRAAERPRSRPPEAARPRQQPRPAERARPTPQRQQASRAAVVGRQASGAGAPDRNALRSFMASVRADIMRQRRNVSTIGNGRTATVRFTIAANGALGGISIVSSSGDAGLDAAAVAMVRRASPVAPIPAGIGRSSLSSRLPVQFN